LKPFPGQHIIGQLKLELSLLDMLKTRKILSESLMLMEQDIKEAIPGKNQLANINNLKNIKAYMEI